ncbi:hypothetical protein ACN38_g6829 [Penicillium nordicum]|uniref:Mitochondrial genome maintenance protein MGM101 n=1 Tax=Penicillium nordicum TaxID=229535 RepID=A0A0M9WF51_9EURO|nr:hypothetical protein ACN38_g6829 [Penicillium nordicum]
MSAPLRIRPWRVIETLQNATQLSRSSRAPNPRTSQLSSPMTKRAISYTTKNQNNQPTAKPPPSSSSSTAKPTPSASTPIPTGVPASRVPGSTPSRATTENISKSGLSDKPLELERPTEDRIDWTRSFHGLSAEPFPKEAADILLAETEPDEVEIKPDGILYLPEIKYRRILNRAFGPGGWGLVPRSESIVTPKTVTREYALVCNGRTRQKKKKKKKKKKDPANTLLFLVSSPSPAANRTISPQMASPPLQKDVGRTRSCAVARI